jgi:hypothetical protein
MTVLSSHRFAAGPGRRAGWTTARIVSAITGVLLALCSLGLLAGGILVLTAGLALGAVPTRRAASHRRQALAR